MRVGRTIITPVLVGVLAMAGLGGCGSGSAPSADSADVIKLGTMLDLSGVVTNDGDAMRKAQLMAVNEANAAGGVLGRQVELIVTDDACDPGTGVKTANELIAAGILISVGGSCSSSTVPTLKLFHAAKIPMIIPTSNSTELLAPGYNNVFLLSGTVVDEGAFALDAMRTLGTKLLAVVHDGTSFPETLAQAVVEATTARPEVGITVKAELEVAQSAGSYALVAKQLVASGVDTVMYTGYDTEGTQLIKDLRDLGYTGRIVGGDGLGDGLLNGLTEAQAAKIYRVALAAPAFMRSLGDWPERFKAATGMAPIMQTVESYDAVTLALDAIRRAGSTDPEAVRRAIAESKDVKLLTGDPRFNANGTRMYPTFLLLGTEGLRFTYISSNRELAPTS